LSDAPIGVFDSGVGGLTVLQALMRELPAEHFVYLGDTARLPYGTKTRETVARYAVQAAEALAEHDVKCLVVACNTASAAGLACIRERFDSLQAIGVIEPGAEVAAAVSESGRIAVIATESTVRGGAYQEAILRRRREARVMALPAPLLVALAEEGVTDGPIATAVARHYLEPIFGGAARARSAGEAAHPDTLVLGCTHFPMLSAAIREAVGERVQIVDSAVTTAIKVRQYLGGSGLVREGGAGSVRFLATDGAERFARIGSRFLGRTVQDAEIELINL
jgi:glutamate racemase